MGVLFLIPIIALLLSFVFRSWMKIVIKRIGVERSSAFSDKLESFYEKATKVLSIYLSTAWIVGLLILAFLLVEENHPFFNIDIENYNDRFESVGMWAIFFLPLITAGVLVMIDLLRRKIKSICSHIQKEFVGAVMIQQPVMETGKMEQAKTSGYFNNTWHDFMSVVGKRLTGVVYLDMPYWKSMRIYFVFDDGSGCELYSDELRPCKNNWTHATIDTFSDMAKKAPKGSYAIITRFDKESGSNVVEELRI